MSIAVSLARVLLPANQIRASPLKKLFMVSGLFNIRIF
jgi:hypothetical protein